ncbi:MAG: polyprenol monophosphomannose synthase [bacterium]|nr:polyprenol monophosphomannose synthase [bacterium]
MDWIITPTYNERNNIRVLVDKIFTLYPAIQVLVVDDNSPDGTGPVVKDLQKKYPNLHLKERGGKLGLASAYLGAFKDVLRDYPDVRAIITMDADLSHDPLVVGEMLQEIKVCDAVFGSRYVRGGGVQDWELWRRLLSWGGNVYARMVTGSRIHDLTGGFKCFRAELLRRYNLDEVCAEGYGHQIEIKVIAEQLNARIREIPITFRGRIEGESKISNSIIYEGLLLPWRFSPLLSIFTSRRRR